MIRVLLPLLVLLGTPVVGAECRKDTFRKQNFVICRVDATRETLRLFLKNSDEQVYGFFANVDADLRKKGKSLGFATNAGMYHSNRSPVGHYVEGGKWHRNVISKASTGNFGMLPNGVLCLRDGRADVYETRHFLQKSPKCRDATQSGPMLVIDGQLHPRFLPDSTSRYIRNGVGTTDDGRVAVFAISQSPVTFHEFGSLFRDHLRLNSALYLDGNISRLRAPDLGLSGSGFTQLGPIIGVVEGAE